METATHKRLFWLLIIGVGLLTLWQLGHLPLMDADEPVYGEVGKEMARAGLSGWLTPHYNGAIWFDKPPLFYWLTALSMRKFGVSEFAARLPSALLGVGLIALTYALARRAYPDSPNAGLWSGLVLATTVQFFMLSHASVTDMTLAFTLTAALLGVYCWIATGRGAWIAAAGAMTGLATLAKGPVAIVLIGLLVILFLLLSRQAKRLLSPMLWAGFALCLLIALPWYLLMIHLHGELFIQGFLEANNVTRYLSAEHKSTQAYYWYIPIFCAFFLPWTLAIPGAIATAAAKLRRERGEPSSPQATLFLVLWFALVFVFFSASQTKLITYIFPLFPAAAILVGNAIAERVKGNVDDRANWAFATLLCLIAGAVAAVGRRYDIPLVTLVPWVVALVGGGLAAIFAARRTYRWLAPGIAFAVFLLVAWCSPVWSTYGASVSDRDAARIAASAAAPEEALHALGVKHASLVYYSDRHVDYSDDRAAAKLAMAAQPGLVYILGPHVLDDLRDKYGLRDYRVLYQKPRLTVIQSTPPENG